MDDVDHQIIDLLDQDARTPVAEVARQVGLSAPAVRERVVRLETSGVLVGYRVELDLARLGLPVSAWVRLSPGPGQLSRVIDQVEAIPEVSECHRISGDDCFLIKVHVPDMAALEVVLDQLLVHGRTTTSIIVSTPIAARRPRAR
jgi:Lrp/AsnC family leucine-responsive transcriptional regulator